MAERIPERVRRAIEILDVRPADRILEIGCGPGVSVALVCARLGQGTITAVDRSAVAVGRTLARNRAAVASGKAVLATGPLAEADLGRARFDKVFAINVNLFWLKAARELARIRCLLAPRGSLSLFYDPPSASKVEEIAARLTVNLQAGGFAITATRTEKLGTGVLLAMAAVPSPDPLQDA